MQLARLGIAYLIPASIQASEPAPEPQPGFTSPVLRGLGLTMFFPPAYYPGFSAGGAGSPIYRPPAPAPVAVPIAKPAPAPAPAPAAAAPRPTTGQTRLVQGTTTPIGVPQAIAIASGTSAPTVPAGGGGGGGGSAASSPGTPVPSVPMGFPAFVYPTGAPMDASSGQSALISPTAPGAGGGGLLALIAVAGAVLGGS